MKPNVIFEKKIGRNYEETYHSEDKAQVYEDLAHEMISKKLCGCSYIRSITRKQMYNGFIKITVTYDNGDRRIYTINDH